MIFNVLRNVLLVGALSALTVGCASMGDGSVAETHRPGYWRHHLGKKV